jgi:hypothetical protein
VIRWTLFATALVSTIRWTTSAVQPSRGRSPRCEEKDRRGRPEIEGHSGFHNPPPANIAFGSELY